jgi:hypothetical protein
MILGTLSGILLCTILGITPIYVKTLMGPGLTIRDILHDKERVGHASRLHSIWALIMDLIYGDVLCGHPECSDVCSTWACE